MDIDSVVEILRNNRALWVAATVTGGFTVFVSVLNAIWLCLQRKKQLGYDKKLEEHKNRLGKELEYLKNNLDKKNHVSKVRFDTEFEIFRRLNEAFFNLIRDALSISPLTYEDKYADNIEKKKKHDEELFEIAYKSFRVAQNQLYQNAVFIDKVMHDKYSNILSLLQSQIFDFENWNKDFTSQQEKHKAKEYAVNRIASIQKSHEILINEIREYIKSLEIIE